MHVFGFRLFAFLQATFPFVHGMPSKHAKRGAETNATLVAYGTSSAGWPIAYNLSDSLLYIGIDPDNTTANLTPLLWDLAAITQEDWIANATFSNGTSAGALYIRPEDNALSVQPIPELAANATTNATFNGFALFATQLVYNNDTNLEAQFWGCPTELDDVYGLYWVKDDADLANGSFPVVVKGVEE